MKSFKLLSAFACAALATLPSAQAGSHTWSGVNDIYFNNTSNWSYGGAPTNGEQNIYLYFPASATRYNPSNNISGLTVNMISFSGDNYTLSGKPITLAGGTNLMSSGVGNSIALPLVMGGSNTAASVTSGKLLVLGAPVSGASHLTKVGPGKLFLNPAFPNLYSGTTFVTEGTLELGGYNFQQGTVPGPLVIGTGAGAPGTAIAQWASNWKIPQTNVVTINNSGVLDLWDNTESIAGLVMAGGTVQTGHGTLAVMGPVTIQTGAAAMNGNLWFYYSNGVFNVAAGGTLNVNGKIGSYIGDPGIVKTGLGALNLYNTNTFTGPAIVKQGYLGLGHSLALSQSSRLVVTNTGIVQMFGVGISNIPATLSGNGNGNGCLRAYGTNIWTGTTTLAGNAGIQPFASADMLIVDAPITGAGNLTKLGAGTLSMTGLGVNNYQGTTIVSGGTLQLGKPGGVAVPGALVIGDATNAANTQVVRLTGPDQIADLADVTLNASGLLDVSAASGASDVIGSLAGGGNIWLGGNMLAAGTNGASTTFSGRFWGTLSGSFEKRGSGQMFLTGDSSFFAGGAFVKGGILSVNGSLAGSPVFAATNATIAGNGVVGMLSAFDGKITPGNSTGLLKSGDYGMSSASVLEVELNGTTAGVTYDQIAVTGFVNLGNANLNVLLGFNSTVSNKFLIIANDGNDAVFGTFKNLPEGAKFSVGNAQFQISYHGGDGNDVELTHVGVVAPPQIGNITRLGNGQIQLAGSGMPNATYDVQANTNLSTTNWLWISTIQADANGLLTVTDTNAANFPQRFYRFKSK